MKCEYSSAIQPTKPSVNEEHWSIPREGTVKHHDMQTASHTTAERSSLSLQLSLPVNHPDKQRSLSYIMQNGCDTANHSHRAPTHLTPTWPKRVLLSPDGLFSLQKTDSEHSHVTRKAPGKPSIPAEQSCSFPMQESCRYAEVYKQPRKLTVLFNSTWHHSEAGKRRKQDEEEGGRKQFLQGSVPRAQPTALPWPEQTDPMQLQKHTGTPALILSLSYRYGKGHKTSAPSEQYSAPQEHKWKLESELFPMLRPLLKWPGLCAQKEWYQHYHLPVITTWLNYTSIMACTETASASVAFLRFCVCWHNSSAILIKAGLEGHCSHSQYLHQQQYLHGCGCPGILISRDANCPTNRHLVTHTYACYTHTATGCMCVCVDIHVHPAPKMYVTMLFSIPETQTCFSSPTLTNHSA